MNMVEQKFEDSIVEIERLIEGRAEERFKEKQKAFVEDFNKITVKKEFLIQQLEKVKEDIKKEYEKQMKYWKETIDAYGEFMKAHPGNRQLNNPPTRPELPKEFEIINGYINMFKCFIKDEIILEFSFLKEIFLKTSEGMNAAIAKTSYYVNCCSGSAFARSNYSLNVDNVNTSSWR